MASNDSIQGLPQEYSIASAETVKQTIYAMGAARALADNDLSKEQIEKLGGIQGDVHQGSPRLLPSVTVVGAPGGGKTAVAEQAGRLLAEHLGKEVITSENIPKDFYINHDKYFPIVTINLAGATSMLQVGAMPRVVNMAEGGSETGMPDALTTKTFLEMSLKGYASGAGGDIEVSKTNVKTEDGKSYIDVNIKGPAEKVEAAIDFAVDAYRDYLEASDLYLLNKDANPSKSSDFECSTDVIKKSKLSDQVEVKLQVKQVDLNSDLKIEYKDGENMASVILPSTAIWMLTKCKHGMFIFDDAGQSAQAVRGFILHLMQKGRVGDSEISPHVSFVLTSNLGAKDGTELGQFSKATAAETSRTLTFLLKPDALEVANHLEKNAKKNAGTAFLGWAEENGICPTLWVKSFVSLYPDSIAYNQSKYSSKNSGLPICNARSLESAMHVILSHYRFKQNWKNDAPDLNSVPWERVDACIGKEESGRLRSHFRGMLRDAVPCANALMDAAVNVDLSSKEWISSIKFPESYMKNGGNFVSSTEKDFSFQLLDALKDQITRHFNKVSEIRPNEENAIEMANKRVDEFITKMGGFFSALGWENKSKQNVNSFPNEHLDILLTHLSSQVSMFNKELGYKNMREENMDRLAHFSIGLNQGVQEGYLLSYAMKDAQGNLSMHKGQFTRFLQSYSTINSENIMISLEKSLKNRQKTNKEETSTKKEAKQGATPSLF